MATYTFSVAGVTMGKRQGILRSVSNSCLKRSEPGNEKSYKEELEKLKVRMKWDKDNPHDAYAVLVQIWSAKKKKWYGIGYVPRKVQIETGGKKVALCVVIAKMLKRDMITGGKIDYIGTFNRFDDGEEKVIQYCKVTVKFRTS